MPFTMNWWPYKDWTPPFWRILPWLVQQDPKFFILVERTVTGIPLESYLVKLHSLSNTKKWMEKYAKLSMDFYKRTGLLHGDVRPANIVYNPADDSLTLVNFEHSYVPPGTPGSIPHKRALEMDQDRASYELELGIKWSVIVRKAIEFQKQNPKGFKNQMMALHEFMTKVFYDAVRHARNLAILKSVADRFHILLPETPDGSLLKP